MWKKISFSYTNFQKISLPWEGGHPPPARSLRSLALAPPPCWKTLATPVHTSLGPYEMHKKCIIQRIYDEMCVCVRAVAKGVCGGVTPPPPPLHWSGRRYTIAPSSVKKKSGLCKTSKRKELYINLLITWIIYENFNQNGLILAKIWMKI